MTSSDEGCVCWQAPSDTSGTSAAAWLEMHDRVVIRTVDGQQTEGRPDGPVWFSIDGDLVLGMQVEADDGASFAAPVTEIAAVVPLQAADARTVLEGVAAALRHPPQVRDGRQWLTAIVDSHHYVEVSIALMRQPCLPPERPPADAPSSSHSVVREMDGSSQD